MIKLAVVENKVSEIENIKSMVSTIPFAQLTGCHLSYKEAMHHAAKHKPDVLITEISLNGTNGLVIAQDFIKALPHIKVVLLHKDGSFAIDGFEIEACDYIVKPFTRDRMIKSLLRLGKEIKQGSIGSYRHKERL